MTSSALRQSKYVKTHCHQFSVVALAMASVIAGSPCRANDYQPGDWIPFPPGTTLIIGYAEYATSSKLDNTLLGEVPQSHLDSEIGIVRFQHYIPIGSSVGSVQLILPFGALNHAQIAGEDLQSTSGIADPLVAAGIWFINDPERRLWFSGLNFVSIPLGTYHERRPFNLSNHRWQNDLQVDVTKGLSDKITIDASLDWIHPWDNHDAGTGRQTLSQDDIFATYLWLSYNLPSKATLSVGYAGTYGGTQTLDGIRTGSKAGEQQLRLSYSQFVTPQWQYLVQVGHDVAASGQFKQDVSVLLRVAKVF